jgi:hypothetical protein
VWAAEQTEALIDAYLIKLGDAPARNFELWPLDAPEYRREITYAGEISYIRQWLHDHHAWLAQEMAVHCP